MRARNLVAEVSGTEPRWFRPPYGAVAASSLVAARHAGLRTVLWTSWGRDWRAKATPTSVIADLEHTWHPGATVLLHDSDITSAPGCWHAALGALTPLSRLWAEQGLNVGTLAEHDLINPTKRL